MTVPSFINVAKAGEIPSGEGRLVMGPFDKPMALFNLDGEYYEINFVCPHMGGPLGSGSLQGSVVTRPWHGWTFDIRDGKADHEGGHCVSAYETKVEGDDILVGWLKPGSEG